VSLSNLYSFTPFDADETLIVLDFDSQIQTDELASGATQANEKNPNQLSGGEKSFSTVALLLSFWDAVGCPVRCLDEVSPFLRSDRVRPFSSFVLIVLL